MSRQPFPDQGFTQRIHRALNDAGLQDNFHGAMHFLRDKRRSQFPDPEAFTDLQRQGQAIRQTALARLPDLLEQLEANCQANGIQVHWAEDDDEACRLIHGILQERDVRKVVKGKSMATEEIGLNHYLAQQGIEALESDMGEYIVQQAGETPSHIIMPAIHKTKLDIARQFAERIPEADYTENVDELIGIGRRVLRDAFQKADAGISGVNFAVAETGTLCLVENEGNGRMSTTVPDLHIAVMGIEKVIPTLLDLPPLLRLLTRSATGQAITTYLNMIQGPRREDDCDGPQEVHLVLLDNGRSRIHADEAMRSTLRCIRCGACMNHCPVYEKLGGHAYGTVYPGPIGQVLMPQMLGLDRSGSLTEACTLNGACGEVCPVGIPLQDLIRELRHQGREKPSSQPSIQGAGSRRKPLEALIWQGWTLVHRYSLLYRIVTRLATRFRWLTSFLPGRWNRYRRRLKPAAMSLHRRMLQTQRRERR
ncbi:LutB/LldF family L-lactate oxidation iron-sulfur protein [Marinobacteraceae bacterium S3BR75-40.1]